MDDSSRLIVPALARVIAAGIGQRGALAMRLDAPTTDVLALDHVVTVRESAPSDLARVLLVSSSGATAVIDRLSRAGLITRAVGSGRRRVLLIATDAGRELHTQALAPLSHDLERLVEDLPPSHRVLLEQFLTRVADLAEREADQLVARAEAHARAASAIPPPVLWS